MQPDFFEGVAVEISVFGVLFGLWIELDVWVGKGQKGEGVGQRGTYIPGSTVMTMFGARIGAASILGSSVIREKMFDSVIWAELKFLLRRRLPPAPTSCVSRPR